MRRLRCAHAPYLRVTRNDPSACWHCQQALAAPPPFGFSLSAEWVSAAHPAHRVRPSVSGSPLHRSVLVALCPTPGAVPPCRFLLSGGIASSTYWLSNSRNLRVKGYPKTSLMERF